MINRLKMKKMKMKNLLMTAIAIFGLAAISIAQSVPSYVPNSGLVGWWPFTGNTIDNSGNGNNGTVNGATLTTDRFGNNNSAYSFDGNSEILISVDSLPILNSNRTLSIWCYSQNYNQLNKMLVGYGNDSPLEMFSLIMYNSCCPSTPAFWARDNDSPFPSPLNDSEWYNLSVVYKNDSIYLYKNGNLVLENNYSFIQLQTPTMNILKVGNFNSNVTGFEGTLDDIGIWNRALTECEISDLYNSQLGSLNTTATQTQTALESYTWPINSQTYTQSGTYTAVIPNAAGCDSTITLDLSLDFTGINEFSEDNLFTVFPNPAQIAINIKADNKLIGDVYTIYDNTGRIVLTGKVNSENTTIVLGNLSGGIYMFSVGENMKQTFKVIKE